SLGIVGQLKKSAFDVVHGHGFHSFPFLFSRYAKARKFVVTTRYHGFGHTPVRNFLFSLYKPLGMRVLKEADNVICISNYEKNLLLSHFKIKKEKIIVIPNGITKKEFQNLKKSDKQSHRTILCVARLEKYKGIHYLIEALPRLDEDICLQIVGKGPYKNELLKLVNRPIESRVKFYQDLPRKELLQLYANADLFVSLSRYEAFGNTISEALASRTPCIVANTSALSERIDDKNCFGIDYPIDAGVLASSINKVIGAEVEGVNLLDWDDVARELETVYQFR
ncbi:MAG: glycosyltransferase family 4 protein, partial [Promethearchaeota archaeon]